jgi:hypothetical protein
MTFAAKMQHKIYWGALRKPLEWSLRTILAPWSYVASIIYHDTFWYPSHQKIIRTILGSTWGRLFHNWDDLAIPPEDGDAEGWPHVGEGPLTLKRSRLSLFFKSIGLLWQCLLNAPEFAARKRRLKDR